MSKSNGNKSVTWDENNPRTSSGTVGVPIDQIERYHSSYRRTGNEYRYPGRVTAHGYTSNYADGLTPLPDHDKRYEKNQDPNLPKLTLTEKEYYDGQAALELAALRRPEFKPKKGGDKNKTNKRKSLKKKRKTLKRKTRRRKTLKRKTRRRKIKKAGSGRHTIDPKKDLNREFDKKDKELESRRQKAKEIFRDLKREGNDTSEIEEEIRRINDEYKELYDE
jgi:hypothetical protein